MNEDKEIRFPTAAQAVNSDALKPYVDKILKSIGVRSAWLTDKSSFGDFSPVLNNEKMKGIKQKIGVEVDYSSLIWATAQKMKELSVNN